MQFCQPAFSGYAPNYNPFNPTQFQCNGYPEIIGEGHVTSVMSPDGSIQYLFLPTTQWCRPQPCNANFGNSNIQWNNNGAWFIRSAFPPMQPSSYQAMCCPSYQGFQSPPPGTSNSCIELHKPNYQVRFHNDGSTSTSDIHYFYPSLRASNWFQKQRSNCLCQTETSTKNSSSQDQEPLQVLCNQPCKCSNRYKTKEKVEDMSYSSNSNTSSSKMSLENCTENKCQKYKTKKSSLKKTQENNCTCTCCAKESQNQEPIQVLSNQPCKCTNGNRSKEKVEEMSYSSNSNTSSSKISLEKCTESKCQKYKTNKSSKKKKLKESNHTCPCSAKQDKTKNKKSKEKVIRICSSGNTSSTDQMELTKSDESSRKKKIRCKETKAICKCEDQTQKVNKSVVTFNEQGCNCTDEFGRETQTKSKVDTGSMTDIKTNKPIQKASYTICGDYESCFGTCSCTTSETESDRRQCPRYSKLKKTK